eukprot:gene6615-15776_t
MTHLEKDLVSLSRACPWLLKLVPKGGCGDKSLQQFAMRGNVVAYPMAVAKVAARLPRAATETQVQAMLIGAHDDVDKAAALRKWAHVDAGRLRRVLLFFKEFCPPYKELDEHGREVGVIDEERLAEYAAANAAAERAHAEKVQSAEMIKAEMEQSVREYTGARDREQYLTLLKSLKEAEAEVSKLKAGGASAVPQALLCATPCVPPEHDYNVKRPALGADDSDGDDEQGFAVVATDDHGIPKDEMLRAKWTAAIHSDPAPHRAG